MFRSITPAEATRALRAGGNAVVLLDVRDPIERAIARIEPSLHIPMESLPDRLGELPRDREIVVYCHVGIRSALVAGYLDAQGFPRVVNLLGGIDRWSTEVDPDVPRYA